MTSQRWLTDADFSPNSEAKSIWWHYLIVIVPETIHFTKNGSLWITGGGMGQSIPDAANSEDVKLAAALAVTTGTITGCLFQVCRRDIKIILRHQCTNFNLDPE